MSFIASPSVRAYASSRGVNIEQLAQTSGRHTLGKEDVDSFLKGKPVAKPQSSVASHARYWDVDHSQFGSVSAEPMNRMAQVASANLSAANAMIPQVTHHDRADMREVEVFRAKMKQESLEKGIKLTALAFHIKILSRCLKDFPHFNASLSADGQTLYLKNYVHVAIAVDTPHGLMVPVIRNADQKGLWKIAREVSELATRAQSRKLGPSEMGGASMSISNLGGIGGTAFTPIVNPPELAILGLTRTELVPQWDGAVWQPIPMVPLDLSYDHRVINGAEAAKFLSNYAGLLTTPELLLV
jgi:pyruvate dehydrogenase E2 component (dihydrolipoamide acetyltransferase)